MEFHFIKKNNNKKLILVFAGWSTDFSFYKDLEFEGYDTLVVNSYTDFNFPKDLLEEYKTVILFAWSLGVYAAHKSLKNDLVSLAVAINGTINPVSETKGINPVIFNSTYNRLNEINLKKFHKRISDENFLVFSEKNKADQDIEKLKKELLFIGERSLHDHSSSKGDIDSKGDDNIIWNKVFISLRDKIFPPQNQKESWSSIKIVPEIAFLDQPHFTDIKNIIKSVIISREKIGEKFKASLSTYNTEAKAQKIIAHKLIENAPSLNPKIILEIGPGSGYFSNLIYERYKPDTIYYVDLFKIEKPGLASNESVLSEDAEDYLENLVIENNGKFDAIVSSSSIQWFLDPKRFFKNCSKVLSRKGFLLLSTFAPDNLIELKQNNPFGLVYRNPEELKNILNKYFEEVHISVDYEKLFFPSYNSIIRHLVATGVTATKKNPLSQKSITATKKDKEDNIFTLTYSPIYIKALFPRI